MMDPHQPFRRPDPNECVGQPGGPTVVHREEEPVVLDPEFHQSVWRPWEDPSPPANGDDDETGSDRSTGTGLRRGALIGAASLLAFGLIVALVVPRMEHPQTYWFQTLVQDIRTQPGIAWSSEAGEPCLDPPNQDEAILTDDSSRVWSLDLETGTTIWSVEPGDFERVTCLPGAGLVAVAVTDPDDNSILTTLLLDAATGAEVANLPGDSTRRVLPLGSRVGLLDATNMLRAVDPAELDTPLWSRQLQVPPGDLEDIFTLDVDDSVVQLIYFVNSNSEGSSTNFTRLLTTADGTSPAWAPDSSSVHASSARFGDVIAQYVFSDGIPSVSLLDLEGGELWALGGDQLGMAGSRFYVSTPSSNDSATGFTDLREVDPRTGESIGSDSYQGWFDYTIAARDHIAVLRGQTLHILDDHLQEQPDIAVADFSGIYEGRDFVYVESTPDRFGTQGSRLTAINTGTARVLWTLDLEKGQRVAQMGRHLLVVDEDGTIHGLEEPS